ncbi:cutinase family protein [Nocardia sp. NBC_00881]|uniref:cutinase family protein n=1 Tax=Nocardia sp. NBC_00881 TaxID=2975995 RepID=UPI00386BEE25|nr:cutinase family protein [Nocardia sp. NBC_00881]
MHSSTIRTRTLRRGAATVLALVTVSVAGVSTVHADTSVPLGTKCPSLYALGVQGSEEAASDAAITSDSGALGQIFGPLAAAAGDLVQRAYVPYGRAPDGTALPYDVAITAAANRLEQMAAEVVARCPNTKIAAAGYAHGAPAVARFANRVGAGNSRVAADQVAGIALLANPNREPNAPVLPGRPDSTTPSAAPGTSGQKVATISLLNPPLSGAGIAASSPSSGYGALTGRVADLCVAGDATCDAPAGGPLASTAANIAARSDLRDPIAAVSTIAHALSATVYTTAVNVVNEDLIGTSLDQLSYQPAKPLGQRLAEASNPNTTPPGPNDALAALFKLGTIGLNAVVSVAQKVFTPTTIAELATVGLANPWAAVATLGAKLATAIIELVPPQTASRWINQAFDAITSTFTDRSALYTLASSAQYSDITGRHGSYQTVPATPTGRSALTATADWFTALARDLAATGTPSAPPQSAAHSTTTVPTTTPRSGPAAPAAPTSSGGP